MHAQVFSFFVLFLVSFTIKKIFCIFKVVGVLCKSNDMTCQKKSILIPGCKATTEEKCQGGVNTFASHCIEIWLWTLSNTSVEPTLRKPELEGHNMSKLKYKESKLTTFLTYQYI